MNMLIFKIKLEKMVSYCVTVLFEISKAAFRAFFWRGWQQRGAVLCGLWDLSSLAPAVEVPSSNHWTIREFPRVHHFLMKEEF